MDKKYGWGIEVEVENNPVPYRKRQAKNEKDGSLRNNGREYISEVLETSADAKNWHSLLVNGLKKQGADFSHRCGVHIHMDFSRASVAEMKEFVRKYLLIEPMLFSLIDKVSPRSGNVFCKPLREGTEMLKHAYRQSSRADFTNSWVKYSALNLRRHREIGSIEFRGLPALPSVKLFNKTVDILEDTAVLSFMELADKYSIPTDDISDTLAMYATIAPPKRDNPELKAEVMKAHWGFEKPVEKELTEKVIIETMRELGMIR